MGDGDDLGNNFPGLSQTGTEWLAISMIIVSGVLLLALLASWGEWRLMRHNFEAIAHLLNDEAQKRLSPVTVELMGPQRGCCSVWAGRLKSVLSPDARNLLVMTMGFALNSVALTVVASAAPLIIKGMGGTGAIPPLGTAVFFYGAAFSNLGSAPTIKRYGRKKAHLFAAVVGIIGAVLGIIGALEETIELSFVAFAILGLPYGWGMSLRFAAMEACSDEIKPVASGVLIMGIMIAGVAGPHLNKVAEDAFKDDSKPTEAYVGSFVVVAAVHAGHFVLLLFTRFGRPATAPKQVEAARSSVDAALAPKQEDIEASASAKEPVAEPAKEAAAVPPTAAVDATVELKVDPPRSLLQIISNPHTAIAILIAAAPFATMLMVMSSVGLEMKAVGISASLNANVFMAHFLAMSSLGYFTGKALAARAAGGWGFGTRGVIPAGFVLFALSCICFLSGTATVNFMLGMMANGLFWNFCFVSGTVLLGATLRPNEGARVQGVNDFIIFNLVATATAITGPIYDDLGYDAVIYSTIIIMGVCALLYCGHVYSTRQTMRPASHAEGNAYSTSAHGSALLNKLRLSHAPHIVPRYLMIGYSHVNMGSRYVRDSIAEHAPMNA